MNTWIVEALYTSNVFHVQSKKLQKRHYEANNDGQSFIDLEST